MGSMTSCFHRCSEEEKLIKHGDDPKGATQEKGFEDEQVRGRWGRGQRGI